jgi:putative FmdB family regulatory protein
MEVKEVPLFEYECLSCGRAFEVLTPRRERDTDVPCPGCGERDVRRRWSTFSGRASRADACGPASGGSG